MARAMWKGVVVLEKLHVPVKLYSAAVDKTVRFNLLHDQDMVRVRQRMVNPETGQEVPSENIRKGVELAPGEFALVTKEELEALEPAESRDITVERFVKPDQISHQWYDRPYYLGPDGDTEAYSALADAIEEEGKEGFARWVMRKREYVGALHTRQGHLALISLRFAEEVVADTSFEAPAGRKPDNREIHMAQQLVEALSGSFKPEDFHATYREHLLAFIEQKAKGHRLRLHKPIEKKPTVKSLADILEASLHATRKTRASA